MHYDWNWSVIFSEPYAGWILSGLSWTIAIAMAGWVIAFVLGSLLGIARTVPNRAIRAVAFAYVELFRNVPLLVQMFLWYFVLPEVLPRPVGLWLKRDLPNAEFWTAVVCLGLYTAVRVGETIRAGISAIVGGQALAGLATGLTWPQVYRHILVPVAFRITLPALTTEFLSIFKNSSLALSIGVLELTARTRQISEYTFQPIEMFLTATVLYVLVTLCVAVAMRLVERASPVHGSLTAGLSR